MLILSAIVKFFELAAKLVYQILKFLRLRVLALYILVCLFVHLFTGIFQKESVYYDFMIIVGVIIGIASLFFFIRSLLRGSMFKFDKGKEREKPVRKTKKEEAPVEQVIMQPVYALPPQGFLAETAQMQPAPAVLQPALKPQIKPNYYRVAQNPKYIMAEYPDRCELYYETEGGMKYIRTDYR